MLRVLTDCKERFAWEGFKNAAENRLILKMLQFSLKALKKKLFSVIREF